MGIGIKELVIILIIVLLLFGTKRLKSLGTDLGSAIKGFRKSIQDEEQEQPPLPAAEAQKRQSEAPPTTGASTTDSAARQHPADNTPKS